MADITTLMTPDGQADWALALPALQSGSDLSTAVLISLFSDAQASTDDALPDQSGDRRGWWGNPSMGSKLWLLSRAKQTTATLQQAEDYASAALAWMLTDGVAASVTVDASWNAPGFLALLVTISRSNGSTVALGYDWAWSGNGAVTAQAPIFTSGGMLDFTDPAESDLLRVI